MALDAKSQAVIAIVDRVFAHVGTTYDAAAARDAMARAKSEAQPAPRVPFEDRVVDAGTDGTRVRIRLYRPAAADDGLLPVLLFCHGGGWTLGDLADHDPLLHRIATAVPCVVVSVDYRLAPEHPYPAGLSDCWAVLEWLSEHASEVGGDPQRLAVGGDSSGGNLAAALTLMSRDRHGPDLVCQLLVYPVTDARCDTPSYADNGEGYLLTRRHMQWFWDQYSTLEQRADPYVSPLGADLGGLPRAVVITAEYDPLRDEGNAYAAALQAAGVQVDLQCYPDTFHGFFSMIGAVPTADAAVQAAIVSLREALA